MPRQISNDELEKIVLAGRYAPSGGNNQSTTFLVIQNEEILTEIAKLVENEFAKMEFDNDTYASLKNSIIQSKKGGYVFHYNAPTLVVLANRVGYDNAMADCAAAMENMLIAATVLNVGSCWINQLKWLNKNKTIKEYLKNLGIDEKERVMGAIALGYGKTPPISPTERFGNPVIYIK